MNDRQPPKNVFTVIERGERSFWVKIGVAFVNRDSSLSIRLDALPIDGKLVVRDEDSTERDAGSRAAPPRS